MKSAGRAPDLEDAQTCALALLDDDAAAAGALGCALWPAALALAHFSLRVPALFANEAGEAVMQLVTPFKW